jgi:septum formation inhibitor-activating ATPase MinD
VDHHRVISAVVVGGSHGGVGKTHVGANLALAFTKLRSNMLAMDADFGLGNFANVLRLSIAARRSSW